MRRSLRPKPTADEVRAKTRERVRRFRAKHPKAGAPVSQDCYTDERAVYQCW